MKRDKDTEVESKKRVNIGMSASGTTGSLVGLITWVYRPTGSLLPEAEDEVPNPTPILTGEAPLLQDRTTL